MGHHRYMYDVATICPDRLVTRSLPELAFFPSRSSRGSITLVSPAVRGFQFNPFMSIREHFNPEHTLQKRVAFGGLLANNQGGSSDFICAMKGRNSPTDSSTNASPVVSGMRSLVMRTL